MKLVVCSVDLNPCPLNDLATVDFLSAVDPSLFGINAQSMLYVFSWGFAAVVGMFLTGYAVGLALGLIKKI